MGINDVMALREEINRLEQERCHHGWRGTYPDEGSKIQTPCPACGARSLFIARGGHLTCARVPSDRSDGCPSPSVNDTVNRLKERVAQAESAVTAHRDAIIDLANEIDAIGEALMSTNAIRARQIIHIGGRLAVLVNANNGIPQ